MPSRKKTPAKTSTTIASPEIALINNLADILNKTGLSEIELEQRGIRVRVSKSIVANVQATNYVPAPTAAAPTTSAVPVASAAKVEAPGEHPGGVKSPMVGTAYLSASPGAAPFITIGASVKQGQTLMIIEAMKTMNQIPSPKSGKVTQIFVDNGQPVEFGEVLMVIE